MVDNMIIEKTAFKIDQQTGHISINNPDSKEHRLITGQKKLSDILSLFNNTQNISEKQLQEIAYEVEVWQPDAEGIAEKLQFGTSFISSGQVNGEYYMTRGHFHKKREKPEIYWGINGSGLLLLMDEKRHCRLEQVEQGSLHHISGHIAHRLINTGSTLLTVGACWPLDAGHDYESLEQGFSVRVFEKNGKPIIQEV